MRVNNQQFVEDLQDILDNYRNDKVNYPWDARNLQEKENNSVLSMYLNTIAKINTLTEFEKSFQGVPLSEWVIPSIFTPLIMPVSVTVDESSEAVNLIDKTNEHDIGDPKGKILLLSHKSFMSINHALRRIFRKDESTWFESVESLRRPILLSEAIKRSAHEGKTIHYHCMPINLQIKFYESECYVYDCNTVAKRYMEKHISEDLSK